MPLDSAPMTAISIGRHKSVEDQLLEMSVQGLSAEQISIRLGGIMTPERVKIKINELLKAPDWLTAAQQEQALLQLLRKNLVDMKDRFMDDEGRAKIELAYIKEIFSRLDNRQAATDAELSTYNVNVGRQLGHVVDLVMAFMKGALREKVDPAQWDAMLSDAVALAQMEIAKKQREADDPFNLSNREGKIGI